jgi:hypothetical protein
MGDSYTRQYAEWILSTATRDAVAKALDAFMPAVDMRYAYTSIGDFDRYAKIINTYRDMDALVKDLNRLLDPNR